MDKKHVLRLMSLFAILSIIMSIIGMIVEVTLFEFLRTRVDGIVAITLPLFVGISMICLVFIILKKKVIHEIKMLYGRREGRVLDIDTASWYPSTKMAMDMNDEMHLSDDDIKRIIKDIENS